MKKYWNDIDSMEKLINFCWSIPLILMVLSGFNQDAFAESPKTQVFIFLFSSVVIALGITLRFRQYHLMDQDVRFAYKD